MIEKTPQYFIEFNEGFNQFKNDFNLFKYNVTSRFDENNKKFDDINQKFEKINDKLDMHFETIGELKTQVTGIELMLRNKSSYEYVKNIEDRTKKLEKVVFA